SWSSALRAARAVSVVGTSTSGIACWPRATLASPRSISSAIVRRPRRAKMSAPAAMYAGQGRPHSWISWAMRRPTLRGGISLNRHSRRTSRRPSPIHTITKWPHVAYPQPGLPTTQLAVPPLSASEPPAFAHPHHHALAPRRASPVQPADPVAGARRRVVARHVNRWIPLREGEARARGEEQRVDLLLERDFLALLRVLVD